MSTSSEKEIDTEAASCWTGRILTLLQRLVHDIYTSPINLILVVLIVFLLVKLFLMKRKPQNSGDSETSKRPPQLPKMAKCDLTVSQLLGYNGVESNGRILTAIYGDIFDVSRRSDLYGPGGSYAPFAGRDATRALSKMELNPSLFSTEYDTLEDLTDKERATARSWHEDFREKYDIVGRLLKPGDKPSVYPAEETTVDGTSSKKTA